MSHHKRARDKRLYSRSKSYVSIREVSFHCFSFLCFNIRFPSLSLSFVFCNSFSFCENTFVNCTISVCKKNSSQSCKIVKYLYLMMQTKRSFEAENISWRKTKQRCLVCLNSSWGLYKILLLQYLCLPLFAILYKWSICMFRFVLLKTHFWAEDMAHIYTCSTSTLFVIPQHASFYVHWINSFSFSFLFQKQVQCVYRADLWRM